MEKEKVRKSNFELLRIIAMIMIVFHHFAIFSESKFDINLITLNRLWNQFIRMGGKIGVNIFVLISGYFLINSSKFKISKVLKLWGQVFFYSITIYAIFVLFGWQKFNVVELIKAILPISFEGWWFASAYFVLYLFSPFINLFLKQLDKQNYKKMLILMTICWCLIPTFITVTFESNSLIWFFYLYSLAGYIRLYEEDFSFKNKDCFWMSLIVVIVTFVSVISFDLGGLKIKFFAENAVYFYNMQRLPMLLISVFLFIGFKNTEIKYHKKINFISIATFGVYLIHENGFIREPLWENIFNRLISFNNISFIPLSIIVVLIVYIVCTIIELLRIHILEVHYMKFIQKIEPKIEFLKDKVLHIMKIEDRNSERKEKP